MQLFLKSFAGLQPPDNAEQTKVKEVFAENQSRYGYRRVHAVIKSKGMIVSEKVVRRIMEEEQLVVPCKKKRKYSSYKGEISPAVENVVARDFHADVPKMSLGARSWLENPNRSIFLRVYQLKSKTLLFPPLLQRKKDVTC
ncbi:MAG: IS3 family transposase [Proteiniphilum sp.]|nr:IS3 family transposase [Proteiniphilum sp.]